MQVNHPVVEATMIHQLEPDAEPPGEGGFAASDQDWNQVELALVEQAGLEGGAARLGPPIARSRAEAATPSRTAFE